MYLHDRGTGTTSPVSLNGGGTATGDQISNSPAISDDGTRVAFVSASSGIGQTLNTGGLRQVYVRDLTTGTTDRLSQQPGGAGTIGNGDSESPALTASGRLAAFASLATNLDTQSTDSNSREDIVLASSPR